MAENRGQVLPFNRSGAEVRALAARQYEQGQPLTALELLRLSLEKDTGSREAILALGETYASMQCWDLSNAAYFSLAHEEDIASECFYAMGCNYYEMQIYSAAKDCLMLALQKEPDAEFAPDAVLLVDTIEEASTPLDMADAMARRRMDRVLDAMDRGKANLASRQIRRVLALGKRKRGIRSLQAFSLLAAGDVRGALTAAREAMRVDPRDVRALCSMASALHANQSCDAARRYLARAEESCAQEDDLRLIIQTACEMDEHETAVRLLTAQERKSPYSIETLYLLAIALYNTGQTEEASYRLHQLRRIDPLDMGAPYLLKCIEASNPPKALAYSRQVPLAEMLARLDQLRRWVHEGRESLLRRWHEDDALASLLRWGLFCGEADIPKAACNVLSTIEDEGAYPLFREVLCDPDVSASLKQSALAALYAKGAPGPYYALIEDRLTLVHVARVEENGDEAREDHALDTRLRKWLQPATAADKRLVEDLCVAVRKKGAGVSEAVWARAVVMAYCQKKGEPTPLSSTDPFRRKAERLARRLIKEEE